MFHGIMPFSHVSRETFSLYFSKSCTPYFYEKQNLVENLSKKEKESKMFHVKHFPAYKQFHLRFQKKNIIMVKTIFAINHNLILTSLRIYV